MGLGGKATEILLNKFSKFLEFLFDLQMKAWPTTPKNWGYWHWFKWWSISDLI